MKSIIYDKIFELCSVTSFLSNSQHSFGKHKFIVTNLLSLLNGIALFKNK